jgi:hypothetical protein
MHQQKRDTEVEAGPLINQAGQEINDRPEMAEILNSFFKPCSAVVHKGMERKAVLETF